MIPIKCFMGDICRDGNTIVMRIDSITTQVIMSIVMVASLAFS